MKECKKDINRHECKKISVNVKKISRDAPFPEKTFDNFTINLRYQQTHLSFPEKTLTFSSFISTHLFYCTLYGKFIILIMEIALYVIKAADFNTLTNSILLRVKISSYEKLK